MRNDAVGQMRETIISSEKNTDAALGSCRQRRIHRQGSWTRTMVRGVIGVCLCYSLILLSIVRCSESSVAPSSLIASQKIVDAGKDKQLQTHENHQLGPSLTTIRNPFSSERTIISGFGSRSLRKTIFSHRATTTFKPPTRTTPPKRIENDESDDEENEDSDVEYDFLPQMVSPKMWVQRPKHSYGSKEDDVLWMLVRDDDPKGGASSDDDNDDGYVVLKLTFDDDRDDWVAERATPKEESDFVREYPLDKWIPIEGLYGTYKVPSGILWILVAGTEPIYEAPPISSTTSPTSETPWWEIRRVTNLEIVHLGNKGYHEPEPTKMTIAQSNPTQLTASRLREEVRQIRLLRKALKQHDFYYVPTSNSQINDDNHRVVTDMTKSLQRCILEEEASREESQQSWWNTSDDDEEDPTNKMPDARFFWNQHAVEPMLRRYKENNEEEQDSELKKQIVDILLQQVVPLTSAFVGIQKNITVASSDNGLDDDDSTSAVVSYDEILISRRSRFRAGTRFTVRGADASGDVANFAETEQICLTTTTSGEKLEDGAVDERRRLRSVASHVQTRGSIPLRWSSPADVKTYRPRVNIGADPLAQARAVRLHILDQLRHYASTKDNRTNNKTVSSDTADIVFVNLVDKHSDQGRLGRAFDEVLKAVVDVHATDSSNKQPNDPATPAIGSDSVKHVWYDFHAEVKGGRWDKLRHLLNQVQPSLTSHGYFMAHAPDGDSKNAKPSGWSVQRLQNAVVRTNCMDCLDRTNVVQSIFGRYMLFQQLSNEADESSVEKSEKDKFFWEGVNNFFREESMTLPWGNGEVAHRLLWANNADAISRLYAGTPALKRDFTRTGKRTKLGALDDGMNSLQRYYLNNFLDADRQEGYDLLVGHAAFSNVIEEEPVDDAETESTDSPSLPLSFLGATRQNILSSVVKGTPYQDREDLRNRLEEIGVSRQRDLDLRWLPGDLQTQVRDQASEPVPNLDNAGEKQDIIPAPAQRKEQIFSSQHAMKVIDERSRVEMPWWSKSDKDWLEVGSEDDDEEENENIAIVESLRHRSQVILTPAQLGLVFYIGLKEPRILGSLALAILSYVYLPECIEHDYQKQKSLRTYIENRLEEEENKES